MIVDGHSLFAALVEFGNGKQGTLGGFVTTYIHFQGVHARSTYAVLNLMENSDVVLDHKWFQEHMIVTYERLTFDHKGKGYVIIFDKISLRV